jgi:hypothetical protein
MKKFSRFLNLLLLPLMLSGCLRMATYPTIDLSRFTPEATADQPTDSLTPAPGFDPAAQEALQAYPLWVGSSWVYEYLGFDQTREVTWRVVETVVDTQFVQGRFAAQVERTAELLEGSAAPDFPAAPEVGTSWLVLVDGNLYRIESLDDFEPDVSWLEMILPIPTENEGWYPDPTLRTVEAPDFGLRTVSKPFQQPLTMGGTYTCYTLSTQLEEATVKSVFCDGVGFVYLELLNNGQDYGYRADLTGFLLQ